jgi:hypothetical protein
MDGLEERQDGCFYCKEETGSEIWVTVASDLGSQDGKKADRRYKKRQPLWIVDTTTTSFWWPEVLP